MLVFATHVDYLVHNVVSLAAVLNQLSLLMDLRNGNLQLVATRGILNGHTNCKSHKQAIIAWQQYKVAAQHGSTISECLGNARSEMIWKNRHYLR